LAPCSIILNFYFGSYLSRSLATRTQKKLLKNILLKVAPWEELPEV
jgi:hypothetical protein